MQTVTTIDKTEALAAIDAVLAERSAQRPYAFGTELESDVKAQVAPVAKAVAEDAFAKIVLEGIFDSGFEMSGKKVVRPSAVTDGLLDIRNLIASL